MQNQSATLQSWSQIEGMELSPQKVQMKQNNLSKSMKVMNMHIDEENSEDEKMADDANGTSS